MNRLILGGPGCGKTTYLLERVEESLRAGVSPKEIGFVAFTRKAANEARDRMAEKFSVDKEDIPYFSTLHSLAFKSLGLSPSQVLSQEKFSAFARVEGFDFTTNWDPESGPVLVTEDDKALSALNFSRLMCKSLQETADLFDASLERARRIEKELTAFKEDHSVLDYTDMLERFIIESVPPSFKLLIVDEAQDLSRLQWRMVSCLADGVQDVYYAGDDDQAIFEWAGADLDSFLSLEAEKVVLPKSHRLPKEVHDLCQKIVSGVTQRYEKDIASSGREGGVSFISRTEDLPLGEGQWLLLARNEYLLESYRAFLWDEGIPFLTKSKSEYVSSEDSPEVEAVLLWERLRRDGSILGKDLKKVSKYLRKHLVIAEEEYYRGELERMLGEELGAWYSALSLPPKWVHHIRQVKARGESLTAKPRITVSTIHGVKGGEADNVALKLDMAKSCYLSYHKEPSSESRVFYVGASRAKKNLFLIDPKTPLYYDLNGEIT